jgi:hypothetical protein
MVASRPEQTVTRVQRPTCPQCQGDIPADDVNVQQGTMVCSACGRMLSVIDDIDRDPVTEAMAGWSAARPPVPEPARVRTAVDRYDWDLEVHLRSGRVDAAAIMLFWLLGWTAGCFLLARRVLLEPTLEHILFAIPFFVAWLLVAPLVATLLFGRERLHIGPGGLDYEWRVLAPLRRRQVDLDDILGVSGFVATPQYRGRSGRRACGIMILTRGVPIRLASGLPDDEMVWLADALQRHIWMLIGARLRFAGPGASLPSRGEQLGATHVPGTELLRRRRQRLERPRGTRWRVERDFNCTRLSHSPSLVGSLGLIGGTACVVLFWNGIVGLFVLELVKSFNWLLFLFLIPFAFIGLLMLTRWFRLLVAPFKRRVYSFTPGEITVRSTRLGMGWTKCHQFRRLDRLELRRGGSGGHKLMGKDSFYEENDRPFSLALVDPHGHDLIEIDALTEAEARWIADELFRDFGQWHVRVGL